MVAPGIGPRCHRPPEARLGRRLQRAAAGVAIAALAAFGQVALNSVAASGPTTVGTSSNSMALQHPAEDKVAYMHDGSLLVGYYDGGQAVVKQVKNPSTSPSVTTVKSLSGSEVALYTQSNASSTDIWIQVGAELGGSPLEQIVHGTYDGSTFTWDPVTAIPGTISSGRQDPSVTWTGKWVIATWWDDTSGSNSDNVFMNWTTDKTAHTGWLSTAIQMTSTGLNTVQVHVRHSNALQATLLVYGAACNLYYRTLLDSKADPSLSNWTSESLVDSGDDCEGNFGGPQIAVDENGGTIHMAKAVTSSNGPSWTGVTYWKGTPDAVPMSSGSVSWSRVIVDNNGVGSTDPPDVAIAVDSSHTVYVVWVTSASSGTMKYATLASPYSSASSSTTIATSGSRPRYPHMPAQAPLSHGYVPIVYQSGTGGYNMMLDTSFGAGAGDTTPPTVPTGLTATAKGTPEIDLSWNASTDNVGVNGYTVYRNGSTLTTVSGSTLSYADKSVTFGTTYSYAVDAFDAAGNHSAQSAPASATTPPDTSPPTVPNGLTAVALKTPEVDLSWNASTDNVGVTGYTIYRNGLTLTTVSGSTLTYADKAVTDGKTYTYTVDAFDAAGNHSAQSAPASANTADVTPPSVPMGLSAIAVSGAEVDLSWNASTDNVGVTGYTVYRNGLALGTVSGSTLNYADKTVVQGITFSYTVDAFDAAGNHSAKSSAVTIMTSQSWTSLGGVLTSAPAVTSFNANRSDVFVRGTDSAMYQRTWNGSSWSGWASLGGVLTSNPAASASGSSRIDIFVRGTDNALYQRTWNGTMWSDWSSLGGVLTSSPAVSSWGANRLDVFVRGTDSGLYHRAWDGTVWTSWEGLGGLLTSDPSAVSWGTNHIDVFVRGSDKALYQRTFNGTTWYDWQSLGGVLTMGVGTASCASGHLDAFVIGSDGAIYRIGYNGAWGTWASLGGTGTSTPGATCPAGTGGVWVYVRGLDKALWQQSMQGT